MSGFEEVTAQLSAAIERSALMRQALIHRSFVNENPQAGEGTNERLEFLGDAVLGFVTTAALYERFPASTEGELTHMRASLVRTDTLARLGRSVGLGKLVRLGKGEEAGGGRDRAQILAGVLEAVIGATYLEQGLDAARTTVMSLLSEELEALREKGPIKDNKSRLQELAQARWQKTPAYVTVATEGPEHAKRFVIEVLIADQRAGVGNGRSKQQAEQEAARDALDHLDSFALSGQD